MNTPQKPIRLTERQRTIIEMLSHGDQRHEIAVALDIEPLHFDWSIEAASDLLGGKTTEHLVALAIRGGHIL